MTSSPPLDKSGKQSLCISSNPLDIANAVRGVIQYATLPNMFVDRRAHQRIPYAQLFPLTPVDNAEDMNICGETIRVAGKNLSPSGLGFFHQEPIPSRYVVVSLQQAKDVRAQYLVKVSWCRFLYPGWYDSGGQIVQIVKWDE